MGAGKSKGKVISKRKYRQELESDSGGFGNLLEKQKGQKYEGYFVKRQGQSLITPDGLIFLIRNQAKNQVYSGFYRNEQLCTGEILYAGEVEVPDYYIGTQNEFTREGFGEYSQSGAWSYIGFWKNGKMDGFGRMSLHHVKESFTGVFYDNQIQGWGQYQRVKINKVLKPKGTKKALQGTEYTTIWSLFSTVCGINPDKHKVIKTEDSESSYLAFPRLEEIFFDARHTSRYIIQICAEYHGELVNIRRRGRDRYEVNYLNSLRPPEFITRTEVLHHDAHDLFYTKCKPLMEDSFDPNFQINDINYVVERVYFIGGAKCRYLVSCDIEDQGMPLTGRRSTRPPGLQGDRNLLYFAKGYIVASQMEIKSHRHELRMYKLAATKNLTPELGICHSEGADEEVILNYHNFDQMHGTGKNQNFPKKYMILTKHLHSGQFLDAILGFKEMRKRKILKPFERLILIKKVLSLYSALQNLGIYHGQIYPCHIYVQGLYREEQIEDCTVKIIDFSESVYTKEDGKEYPSRFEASLLQDPMEARRNPKARFYVHRHYRCPRQFRMFQHPIFSYYASQHADIDLGKLFFDIRFTDEYSLLVTLLILLAPSLKTEDTIKKNLEEHAQEYFQNCAMNRPVRQATRRKSFLEKQNVSVIEEILTRTYSHNQEVALKLSNLVRLFIEQMEACTPDIRTGRRLSLIEGEVLIFDELKRACKEDLGSLIAYFRSNEFKVRPGREQVFGAEEENEEDLHRTIANRLLGALHAQKSIQEQQEFKREKKESIFDRFFGEEWKRPDQDANEDEKEGHDQSFVERPNSRYHLPPMPSPPLLPTQVSDTFSSDIHLNDDISGIQRQRALTKKLNFPVNIIKEEEHASDRGAAMQKALEEEEQQKYQSPVKARSTMAINSESSGSPAEDFKQFRKYTKTKKGYIGIGSSINDEKDRLPGFEKKYLSPRVDPSQELLMIHNVSKHSPRQNVDQLLSPKRDFPFADRDKYGDAVFGSTREVKIEEQYADENNLTDGDDDL